MTIVRYQRGSKVETLQDAELDFPTCICGHQIGRHYKDRIHPEGICVKDDCGCKNPRMMDWITGFCNIPEVLNTSILKQD